METSKLHRDVVAAVMALTAHGLDAEIVRPDGRASLLQTTAPDGTHLWIGAPEHLPEDEDESAAGWVANHRRDADDDFIDAPYFAWDDPDPEPMAAAVASYLTKLATRGGEPADAAPEARRGPASDVVAPGTRRTLDDLIAVVEQARRAALITPGNAENYRAGARWVLSALGDGELVDVDTIDAERAIAAFAAEQGERLSEATIRTYVSGFRQALSMFRLYVADPGTWYERAAASSGPPAWKPTRSGGLELKIPLPRKRTMLLRLPADFTTADVPLARSVLNAYLRELPRVLAEAERL
jgi:hypothetical protein